MQKTAKPSAPVRVVVLGGGPTGLYAMRRLVDHPETEASLIEKESIPGGLATSHRFGENFYDMGVHMLHEFDEEIYKDILAIMGPESHPVQLNARIRWAGSFYRYPLQFADMIRGIPPLTLARCIVGLLTAQTRYKFFPHKPRNAEEALQQLYGDPLYRFFFKDFTHRYWGFSTTELSATFITSKMPRLTAVDVLKKVLAKFGIKNKNVHAVDSALLEETLHYSTTGAEAMPRHLARYISERGGRIHFDSEVSAIEMPEGKVTAVKFRNTRTGVEERVECDYCINTIPLMWLLRSMRGVVPEDVLAAARRLRYKPITIHGLLVKRPKCLDALYIYYRERIFHRIGEPKNAGLVVNPPDHTVLIVETTCEKGDDKWNATPAVRAQIIADLEAEKICRGSEIAEWHVMHAETGYPVFDLGFEPYHQRIKDFIDSIPNLQSTGRQGGFCYPNMHSAMRMGAQAADHVLEQAGLAGANSAAS
ncbi:MAG: FAD-dependent oxidoreductase [Verrucomicrobiales bacterium]